MFELNRLYNADCMEAMKEIPDKFFELAITDPPYGIGADGQRLNINKNPKHSRKEHAKKDWDGAIPSAEYFRELERVSVNQIIWGGNYFVEHLQIGAKGWIVWDKGQHGLSMSDCDCGNICKPPSGRETKRRTRKGRRVTVTRLVVAVNTPTGAYYVPCVCWNEQAEKADDLKVGDYVEIYGRFQSRNFKKRIQGRKLPYLSTSYEVSVVKLEAESKEERTGEK